MTRLKFMAVAVVNIAATSQELLPLHRAYNLQRLNRNSWRCHSAMICSLLLHMVFYNCHQRFQVSYYINVFLVLQF